MQPHTSPRLLRARRGGPTPSARLAEEVYYLAQLIVQPLVHANARAAAGWRFRARAIEQSARKAGGCGEEEQRLAYVARR